MKPKKKLILRILSILFVLVFFAQTIIESVLIFHTVKNDGSISGFMVSLGYYFSLLWLPVSAILFYKTTHYKQTWERQLMVFGIAVLGLAPFAGLMYALIVLLPVYSLAGAK